MTKTIVSERLGATFNFTRGDSGYVMVERGGKSLGRRFYVKTAVQFDLACAKFVRAQIV